jgi:stage II sporulation protein AA (anti-sigma F factor antagonist)
MKNIRLMDEEVGMKRFCDVHRHTPSLQSRPARSSAARTGAVLGCGDRGWVSAMSPLDIRVAADETGPVVMLSGEADLTTLGQLEDALNAQIAARARILTVDLSGLRFADSATIGALVRAARTLKDRGGRLDLLNPRPGLDRLLSLLGVNKILTVRGGATPGLPCPASRPDDRRA